VVKDITQRDINLVIGLKIDKANGAQPENSYLRDMGCAGYRSHGSRDIGCIVLFNRQSLRAVPEAVPPVDGATVSMLPIRLAGLVGKHLSIGKYRS
jgi:hypothetical protein